MRARHRLSKLLLRNGVGYYGGTAWTGVHDRWLRQQGLQLGSPAARAAFGECYDAVVSVAARRDRLDAAIGVMAADSEFRGHPPAGVPAGHLDPDRVRVGGRDHAQT